MPPGVEAASFGAGGAFSGEKTLEGVEQVAAGEDADERTIVDDRETTAFGQLHASESGKQSVGRRDGFRITGHHAFDGGVRKNGVVGILGDGNQARRSAALNVAVREKADEFLAIEDGQMANGVSPEQDGGVHQGCRGRDRDNRRAHDVADQIFFMRHRRPRRDRRILHPDIFMLHFGTQDHHAWGVSQGQTSERRQAGCSSWSGATFAFRILNKMVILMYPAWQRFNSLPRNTCFQVFVCGKPANDLV